MDDKLLNWIDKKIEEIYGKVYFEDIREQIVSLENKGFEPCSVVVSPKVARKLEEYIREICRFPDDMEVDMEDEYEGEFRINGLRVRVLPELDKKACEVLIKKEGLVDKK